MKVAFFYFLKFGGAKRVVMDQVRGFTHEGIIADVYTINHEKDFFDPSPFASNFKNYGFQTKYINLPFFGKLLYFYYVLVKLKNLQEKIAKEIDDKKYDVVIVHPDMYTQAPYILRYLKTKTVYYSQEPYRIAHEHSMRISDNLPIYIRYFEHLKRFIIKLEDRKNVNSSLKVAVSSLSVRERMIHSYDVYAHVLPPGINTDVFKKRGFKKSKGILFVGSKTDPIDGYDLLEKALKLIKKSKRPKVNFVVWKKKNNERLTEKELAKIYEVSKITMCMSRFETFGLIPLESMACGTPVIATNIGGHRETVLDGKTGYLVEPDPYEIANKIEMLVGSNKYNKMSEDASNYVLRKWNLRIRNKDFINYCKKIVNRSL